MPRKSKTAHFTKRGTFFGSLWAVFSIKADRILLLNSDRQLAHWLLNLEFSNTVLEFSFTPGSKSAHVLGDASCIEYHVEVKPNEGPNQLHYLKAEGYTDNYESKKIFARRMHYEYIEFNDDDWLPAKHKILPLLKVSSFLNGGRHVYVPEGLKDAAQRYVHSSRKGNLRGFLSAAKGYDQNLCLLVFSRMYSAGQLDVSFSESFFSYDTVWWLHER